MSPRGICISKSIYHNQEKYNPSIKERSQQNFYSFLNLYTASIFVDNLLLCIVIINFRSRAWASLSFVPPALFVLKANEYVAALWVFLSNSCVDTKLFFVDPRVTLVSQMQPSAILDDT